MPDLNSMASSVGALLKETQQTIAVTRDRLRPWSNTKFRVAVFLTLH